MIYNVLYIDILILQLLLSSYIPIVLLLKYLLNLLYEALYDVYLQE